MFVANARAQKRAQIWINPLANTQGKQTFRHHANLDPLPMFY